MFGRTALLFGRRTHAPVMYGGVTLFGREYFATEDSPGMTETRRRLLEQVVDPNESGMDRLQVMYSFDQYGDMSPELNVVKTGFYMGLAGGGIVGATVYAKEAMERFMRRNVETQFMNHLEAKRALQDSVTLAMMRGGVKWGLKLGIWTGGFLLVGLSVATFRNKSGILEYILGGAVIGTLFKFSLGPKGMAAGALVGALGGLFAGLVNLGLMLATGTTMAERRYWLHHKRDDVNAEKKFRSEVMRRKDKVYDSDQLLHESRLHEEELAKKGLLDRFRQEVAEEVEKERAAATDNKLEEVIKKAIGAEQFFEKEAADAREKKNKSDAAEDAKFRDALLKSVEILLQEKEAKEQPAKP